MRTEAETGGVRLGAQGRPEGGGRRRLAEAGRTLPQSLRGSPACNSHISGSWNCERFSFCGFKPPVKCKVTYHGSSRKQIHPPEITSLKKSL